MGKIRNISYNCFNTLALLLMICSLGFYIISIIITNKHLFFERLFLVSVLFACILFLLVIYVSKFIKTDEKAIVLISALSLSLLLILNIFVKTVPISDYEVLWNGAKQIVEGTFNERAKQKDDYFCFYNFQIGYTFYLSVLYRILHGSIAAARIVELFVMTLTNIVMYKTFRLFQGVRNSVIGVTLFACFPFLSLGSGILNNQHEAMLFEALAIFLYLKYVGKKGSWCLWILVGCFLYIGEFMRPTATIVLLAVIIMSLLQGLLKHNKEYYICAALITASYIVISCITNECFVLSGLAPYGLKNHNLWFKLLLGLTGAGLTQQPTIDAEHTNLYFDLKYFDFDYDVYKHAASDYLQSLLMTNSISGEYVLNKMINFAGGTDNQYGFSGSSFYAEHQLLVLLLNTIGLCFYFTSIFLSIIRCLIRRILDYNEIVLPALIFLGYFTAYVLFETQTRYRYEQYYMLFLLAVPAMAYCWRKICNLLSRGDK